MSKHAPNDGHVRLACVCIEGRTGPSRNRVVPVPQQTFSTEHPTMFPTLFKFNHSAVELCDTSALPCFKFGAVSF
jgi:hypothetical protein